MSLTLDELREAVDGNGVGIRARTALEPLGGQEDKVFPPTYSVSGNAETRYAVEQRRVDEQTVDAVVLDSVASQANRFETALLQAHRRGEISLPVISTDFRGIEDLAGFDRISSFDAPHRVFDAILRDSLLGDRLFRLSEVGQSITEATIKNAAALFRYSPSTLLFGGWDSTGPKGGRGAKYERAITSEIVGIGVVPGKKTSSRIDPVGIEKKAGPLYKTPDGDWTLDKEEATLDGKNPALYKRGKEGEAGRPSQANHGNIAPSLDSNAGGVTVDHINATTVISLAQLRRLKFPVDASGAGLAGDQRAAAELAARTALAALGLAAAVLAFEDGFDLRSRCVLYASDDLSFELVRRGSTPATAFTLDRASAVELLRGAAAAASAAGLAWESEEILLQPADRLVKLIRESRRLAFAGESD